ncbi:uncharacterized protein LOC100122902 [Nasonia vitripennis]|uniref:Uncharacterized protein n=1 Tax=Nasonia vitripennis TaxID=7425 RepID=A0A7M7G5S8_NASVI|nr:uncharacterized protein LOC100122902 [Nasonia vitripennis]
MKVTLAFCLLALMCIASAEIETCSDVSSCSEALKSRCNEMSESLKESGSDQKLALACKNGVCMCNIEFVENVAMNPAPTEANVEKEKEDEEGKEAENTEAP